MTTENKSILTAELKQAVQTIKGAILQSQSRSEQLRRELPGLRGFSEESIKKMRTFAEFWSQYLNRSPTASEINRDEFLGISFSHHMEILRRKGIMRE